MSHDGASDGGSGEGTGGGSGDPGVGSVAEETAKLVEALQGWARDHAGDAGLGGLGGLGALGGLAAGLAGDEHLATGSAACTVCPVCRAIAAVRQTSPEVRTHLTAAASSLLQAAAGLLDSRVPPSRDGGPRDPGVHRIDLDGDEPSPDRGWDAE